MLTSKRGLTSVLVLTLAIGLWRGHAAGDVTSGEDFDPNESVNTIRVEPTVANGGEDLDEPISLDLGLGFPLWLHRLGRVEDAEPAFGAVSQVGTESHAVPAGTPASFEFSTTAAAGLDD